MKGANLLVIAALVAAGLYLKGKYEGGGLISQAKDFTSPLLAQKSEAEKALLATYQAQGVTAMQAQLPGITARWDPITKKLTNIIEELRGRPLLQMLPGETLQLGQPGTIATQVGPYAMITRVGVMPYNPLVTSQAEYWSGIYKRAGVPSIW